MTESTMTCDAFDARLSDYLEGSLDADTYAAADAHLRACTRCAQLVHDLRAIERDARALPTLEPERDLWSGIESRLESAVIPLASPASASTRRAPRLVPRFAAGWLAAAAVLLVAATAGITYQVTKHQLRTPAGAPAVATAPTGNGTVRTVASSPLDATYASEIVQLRATLEARRSELDPATVAVIERNLHVIDAAIAQSRAALARDPASTFLRTQLNDALGQKVELLRTAALLPSST